MRVHIYCLNSTASPAKGNGDSKVLMIKRWNCNGDRDGD